MQFHPRLFMIARRQRHVRFMNVIQRSSLSRHICTYSTTHMNINIYAYAYAYILCGTENKHEQNAVSCSFSTESLAFPRHAFEV